MAIIEKLHILRFRNLDNQYLELNKNINLFIGSNGQGKTNLLRVFIISDTTALLRQKT